MQVTSFQLAKDAFARGENVTAALRDHLQTRANTPEIVEIAYDLQAGSYIQYARDNAQSVERYTSQLAEHLIPELAAGSTLLDVGSGEFTNLSHLARKLPDVAAIHGFDISFSRVRLGLDYVKEVCGEGAEKIIGFVGELSAIPLPGKSVDIVISNHALEPNGGREKALLAELFRVARRKLVLFEPCYEINSEEGRARMDRLGYIKQLGEAATALGGRVEKVTALPIVHNPLNPTACFIIAPPETERAEDGGAAAGFTEPGTDRALQGFANFLFSPHSGLSYPVLDGIPILRNGAGILTSVYATMPEYAPTR